MMSEMTVVCFCVVKFCIVLLFAGMIVFNVCFILVASFSSWSTSSLSGMFACAGTLWIMMWLFLICGVSS